MRCNQRFFGQEVFEQGTAERNQCTALAMLKPAMAQYGFALRDRLPELQADTGGLVQVKYNGMLAIVLWDEALDGFAAWNPRGRRYFSLPDHRTHPVIEFFNAHQHDWADTAFVGETYVVRRIDGKSYMTEFNRSMSIIKNPQIMDDVRRIRLAVFDYAPVREGQPRATLASPYRNRFERLRRDFGFPVGCDSGAVHLPDYHAVSGTFREATADVQAFWDEFVGERRFEGVVLHTDDGHQYKVKFRDTLDVAIIAFRMRGTSRPVCNACGAKFDAFWLRTLAKDGSIRKADWFDAKGRLRDPGTADAWWTPMAVCPHCGGAVTTTPGPILGAKVALMTAEGHFVDIADGAQLSPISPILDRVEPLYEADGYLWVAPKVVVEVSYQGDQLYADRTKPVYRYEDRRYVQVGSMTAVSLRPYRIRLREDKTVNPQDLRLEQLSYFVDRVRRLRERWHAAQRQDTLHHYFRTDA